MLTELLGRQRAQKARTERPWLRIDIGLNATLPYGKPIPIPPRPTWAEWVREVTGRLERIERLVPAKAFRKGKGGMLEVLAWHGEPTAEVTCAPGGELLLEGVAVAAWQALNLPRQEDDFEPKPDANPGKQLTAMFKRVRSALHGWMEAMDHLSR